MGSCDVMLGDHGNTSTGGTSPPDHRTSRVSLPGPAGGGDPAGSLPPASNTGRGTHPHHPHVMKGSGNGQNHDATQGCIWVSSFHVASHERRSPMITKDEFQLLCGGHRIIAFNRIY